MLTLDEVWTCLSGTQHAIPKWPSVALSEVVSDPKRAGPGCLFVALPDRPVSPETMEQLARQGAVAFLARQTLPSNRPIRWLPVEQAGGQESLQVVTLPVGLIVGDVGAAVQKIAAAWRAKSSAQGVGLFGSEGLRTLQRLTQLVLSQRFQTNSPDGLACDALSAALAVLALRPYTQRLVLRLNLNDAAGFEFVQQVAQLRLITLNNLWPDSPLASGPLSERFLALLTPETTLVINADDPEIQRLAGRSPAKVFSYGVTHSSGCDLWASHIESQGREGLRLRLHYRGDIVHVRIPLLGRYSVHTALAASALGLVSGLSWDEIVAGLRAMSAQLHLIMTPGLRGATFLEDSYDATPASTLSALNLLDELPGRKVAVLGDMMELGHLEAEEHKKVGRRVMEMAAYLITLGSLGWIIGQEAVSCGMPAAQVYAAADQADAVNRLRDVLQPGDLVLVAGARWTKLKQVVDALLDLQSALCET